MDIFPAISVAVSERVWTPSGSTIVGMSEYEPEASTMAVARIVPDPSFMVIVSPGVPEPVMVGVASAVANGAVASPPTVPGRDGGTGGVVSNVTRSVVDELTLPVASVDVAVRLLIPSARGEDGVNIQFPEASAIVVPIVVPDAFFISTVLLASAVPVIVGVVVLVRYGLVVSHATFETTGADGTRESMMRMTGADVLVLPTVSVVVTERVLDPSGSGAAGVNIQFPEPSTVPVPRTALPVPVIVKIVFASPVPVRVGVVSEMRELLMGVAIVGTTGAVVSTVKVVTTPGVVLPAISVRVTL